MTATVFSSRFDQAVRRQIPALLTASFSLLAIAPSSATAFTAVMPVVPLIMVFAWALARPDLMSPAAAFLCGLVQDLLIGLPVGLSAAVFLVVQQAVVAVGETRLFGSLWRVWLGFTAVALAAGLVSWVAVSALGGRLMPVGDLFLQAIVGAALYPWLDRGIAALETAMPRPV